jgi:hypothetical protein
MPSLRRHQLRTVIVVASAALGLAGVSHRASAAPQVLTGPQKVADLDLPASALAGTGIGGAFNRGVMSSPQLTFTLPDGRTITAFRQRTAEDVAKGRKSWVGTFKEQPGSIAVVTHYKGSITGFLSYGSETWELMPGKAGAHVLYRVDDARLPRAEPEVEFPAGDDQDILSGSTVAATDATASASGGHVHDLLVVYTPATSAAYGQATLESMVQNAVAAANQAYQNSGIAITLNLVGLQQVAYVETGAIQTSLNDLRGTGDGNLDDVHRLRDSLGADVVSLVSRDSDACGIAGVMTTVSTSFAANAFNVVNSRCLSNHSLAHEIGHNQGNKHDRASTTGSGAYAYSYGFRRCVSDGTGFRTVMAYSCSGANRVARFSNPSSFYNGYATGIAYESDPANSADNARSMNNTAGTVAAFRPGGSSTTPTPVAPTTPTAPSAATASATAYNSVTVRWSDNSANETGFKLERSGNGVDYSEIATLGAGTTSRVDNGVIAGSNFYYRVRAYNSAGNSAYSNVATVTTPAASVPVPVAPSSVAARNDGDGSATVTWTDASTTETGFEVRREKWDAKRAVWSGLATVGTVPAGYTGLDDLCGNGTYRYSVRAVNAAGASRLAGPASVTVTGGATRGNSGK